MTRSAIHIPLHLDDRAAVMGVLDQLNLLKTGQTTFGPKEVGAALRWAHVPAGEHFRFKAAMEKHGLFWKIAPGALRRMKRVPVLVAAQRRASSHKPDGEPA